MKPRLARPLAFFTSASVLVLEILAGRLLAPYVGITLQTYTSIIGVVLAGIALGSWLGGWLADRHDPRMLIGPTLMLGGGLGLLSAPIVRLTAKSLDGTSVTVVLAATIAGFLLPSIALSAVGPMLTKTQLQSLESSGATVGAMSAISTAGSIVGTFVTGFVLVANVAVGTTILVVGLALILVGLVLAGTDRSLRPAKRLTVSGLLVFGGCSATALTTVNSPCEIESAYYCASVLSPDPKLPIRVLRLDNLDHSEVDLSDPTSLRFAYTQLFGTVVDALAPGPIHAVHLGGGALTMPRYVRATRPGSTGVVLEVDVALPKLAARELGWKPGPDVQVVIGDGRVTMATLATMAKQRKRSADIVFGDAFGAEAVPWHLTTREFVETIRGVLDDGGVYAVNVIDAAQHRFVRAVVATVSAEFSHVAVLAPQEAFAEGYGSNFIVIGSKQPLPTARYRADIGAKQLDAVVLSGAELRRWVGTSRILRDDFAPVDQLFSTGE